MASSSRSRLLGSVVVALIIIVVVELDPDLAWLLVRIRKVEKGAGPLT